MSGETEGNVSGWTVDTLRAHIDSRLDAMQLHLDERYMAQQTAMQTALAAAEKAVESALESAEKAVVKAETAAEKRFEAVNEFRGQLSDQAGSFLSRPEYDAKHEALADRIEALSKIVLAEQGKKAGSSQTIGLLIAVGGLMLTIVIAVVAIIGTR